ncbi:hypothetical protein HID58_046433 [Brassica napus]|uniref:Uncharacterized protein n=1 Tax=Brassica napus TaxID=3708 RepID=A0ABQ8AWF1_BRANA|nr:hypothetical protein HID58_046433 [Brassica napus]
MVSFVGLIRDVEICPINHEVGTKPTSSVCFKTDNFVEKILKRLLQEAKSDGIEFLGRQRMLPLGLPSGEEESVCTDVFSRYRDLWRFSGQAFCLVCSKYESKFLTKHRTQSTLHQAKKILKSRLATYCTAQGRVSFFSMDLPVLI